MCCNKYVDIFNYIKFLIDVEKVQKKKKVVKEAKKPRHIKNRQVKSTDKERRKKENIFSTNVINIIIQMVS